MKPESHEAVGTSLPSMKSQHKSHSKKCKLRTGSVSRDVLA